MPAGLAFREGKEGTFFEDMNPYLVHTVKGAQASSGEGTDFSFRYNSKQKELRMRLYDGGIFGSNIYSKYGGDYQLVELANEAVYEKDTNQTFPTSKYATWQDWPQYKTAKEAKKKYPDFSAEEIQDLRILKCMVESSGGSYNT